MDKPVSQNQLYPVFLKLDQLHTLIVGGGEVCLEKLNSLLTNSPGARISIVAPEVKQEIKDLIIDHPNCRIIQRCFEEADLDDKQLVILATRDRQLHLRIKQLTSERRILTNVADTPDLCDFYLGSIVNKGHIKIAISTNGQSPTMAKRLKEVFQSNLPDELDELVKNLNKVRGYLSGDFKFKVQQLNEITRTLIDNDK